MFRCRQTRVIVTIVRAVAQDNDDKEKREMRRETERGEKRQKGNQRTAESSEQRAAEKHKRNV